MLSKIKKNPKEVIFTLKDPCDNESYLKMKRKNEEVIINYYNNHCNLSLVNLQLNGDYRTDLIWGFTDNDFEKIIDIINNGVTKVISIRSR